jgi:hypothetical protein
MEKYGRAGNTTDYNITGLMHFVCGTFQAANTD